jgi:hypothetical protein
MQMSNADCDCPSRSPKDTTADCPNGTIPQGPSRGTPQNQSTCQSWARMSKRGVNMCALGSRWITWGLVALVSVCLALAAWVWTQIFLIGK